MQCYVCAVQAASTQENRWRKNHLTYQLLGTLRSVPLERFQKAFAIAFARISDVCNITSEEIRGPLLIADINVQTGRIDGPRGTLAWSQLADGSDRPLQQRYDDAERWGIFDDDNRQQIDLTRVICHELMHALGIGHIEGPKALINPTYSDVTHPLGPDIKALQDRYGKPKTQPPVDPNEVITVTIPRDVNRVRLHFDGLDQDS